MTTPDQRSHNRFFALVERDLQLRHVPFDQGELRAFVADVWPLARHEPDPQRWAEAFLVALQGRECLPTLNGCEIFTH
jgi:hypothetical protein